MFFSVFGGAWLALWLYRGIGLFSSPLIVVVAGTLGILALAVRQYKQNQAAHAAEADTPEKKKADRLFSIVNITQWVVILVVGNVLANIGMGNWVIPAAILIVGLHFLPLAKAFGNPALRLTGAALILIAVTYPFMAPTGPASPVGCLGAGLVLWGSALRAVI